MRVFVSVVGGADMTQSIHSNVCLNLQALFNQVNSSFGKNYLPKLPYDDEQPGLAILMYDSFMIDTAGTTCYAIPSPELTRSS
jgi:hypothetical protein